MCVDPWRLVRAAAVLASSSFLVVTFACGGPQPRQQAEAPAPAGPKVLTAAERAAWYQDCWAHFNNKAWDKLKACYADNAESDQVDSGQPVARGVEAVLESSKSSANTFPDMKGTGELILIKGDTIASIYLISGTHTGPMPAPGGQSLPATNKPFGYLQGHLVQTDATGGKAIKEEFYQDTGTLMAQLGLNPGPARPVMGSAKAAPTIVIARGTPAELSNVESMRAQMGAYNTHDASSVGAFNAPDLVYHDMTMQKDQTAKENLAGTQELFRAFPDSKLTPLSAWGAVDYVVVTGRFEGTNKGPMPAMGLKKGTGKTVSARYLDIARWENGKIKEEWLFYDGMAMARQLGLGKQ